MAQSYQLIQAITVGSGGAASIEFTNIPATYTDLVVKISSRFSAASVNKAILMRFNSDASTSNYKNRRIQGNGSTTTSSNEDGYAGGYVSEVNAGSSTASAFGNVEIYIPNYAGSKYKYFSVDSVMENNATTAYAMLLANYWSNTAAITSITLLEASSDNYVQYSTAYLYGVGGSRASGGTITADGNYTYHTFTSSGTFTTAEKIRGAEALVIAGGGAGSGAAGTTNGGGGGAGGLSYRPSKVLTAGSTYTITIGAGGAGGATGYTTASPGTNSEFDSIISNGGGGGGNGYTPSGNQNGQTGGSGGGGGNTQVTSTATGGSSSQGNTGGAIGYGNAGGTGYHVAGSYANGGGGGGAGAVGQSGETTDIPTKGGNGGNGLNTWANWATATSTGDSGYYAGGGGGSGETTEANRGLGGLGGGGISGLSGVDGTGDAGLANTGGGGGGAPTSSSAGGSGLVIIRYPNS